MPVFDNSLGITTEPPPLTAGIASSPAQAAPAWQPVTIASRDIPAGDRCLAMLDATGTSYKKLSAKHGIETPIEVTGDIGGVRYEPAAGQTLLCDCRFAVALHRVAPVMKSAGVTRVRFSGAYSYRMSRVGRLSLHAYGLALDVHELGVNGSLLTVRRDFTRGLGNGCASDAPALNQVACRLKSSGMFRELLTPDSNSDHWDHFHLGVEPLTNSPVGTVVAKPKKPAAKPIAKASPKPAPVEAPENEPLFLPDEEPALDIDADDDEPEVVLDAPKTTPRITRRGKEPSAEKSAKKATRNDSGDSEESRKDQKRAAKSARKDQPARDESKNERRETKKGEKKQRAAREEERHARGEQQKDERASKTTKDDDAKGAKDDGAKDEPARDVSKRDKKRDKPDARKKSRRSARAQRTGST